MLHQASLYLMAALYTGAGVWHFVRPRLYLRIMPPWLPAHGFLVAASGVAEVVLGVGLLFPATRALAAWGIIVMLVAFLLVHVDMAARPGADMGLPTWALYLRILLQGGLIYWAYTFTR